VHSALSEAFKLKWPYHKSKLELNSKKSRTRVMQKIFLSVFGSFFFGLKAELQVLKFEFR